MKYTLIIFMHALLCSCIIIPVPHYVKQGRQSVQKENISFIKTDTTLREDVLLKLGEPDGVACNQRIFIYHWTNVVAWYAAGGAGQAVPPGLPEILRGKNFYW